MTAALLAAGTLGLAAASALTPGEALEIFATYTEFATTAYTTTFDPCAAQPPTPQPSWITLNGNLILEPPMITGHCEYATGTTQYTMTYTYDLGYGFVVGTDDVGRTLTLAAAIHDMNNTVAVVTGTVTAAPTTATTTSPSETTTATTQTAPTATTPPPTTTAPSTTTAATTTSTGTVVTTTGTVATTPKTNPRAAIITPAAISARFHGGVVTIHIATRSVRPVLMCYRAAAGAHKLTCTSRGRAWTIKLTVPKGTMIIRRVFSLKANGRTVAKKTITIKVRRA